MGAALHSSMRTTDPSACALKLRSEMRSRFDVPFEVRRRPDLELIPTGIPAIDQLTAGGIPRGTMTEICGTESTGRTALMFALLSQATRRGECCAWIDTSGAFDPASAAEAGVDLDRVLWVNCGGNAQHALKSTDLLIQGGGFGLVVLDLADTANDVARRIPLASWFRLRHAAERTGAALVCGRAADQCAVVFGSADRDADEKSAVDRQTAARHRVDGGEPETLPLARGGVAGARSAQAEGSVVRSGRRTGRRVRCARLGR